ncbi:MAG: hypothetical protein H7239_02085 [Flavobacterium sp.]|nr:hypothetical protein [Flavobacterium sp.]
MTTRKYSSYEQIEKELEILNLEKEIHYQKLLISIDKTKEYILPSQTISVLGDVYQKAFSGTYGTLLRLAIPYIFKWFINKKRGN